MRELRKERNLSQEQLGEKLGVTSRSVSRWENGNTMPDISLIIELADLYNIDIRELLSGERKSETMNENMRETLVMVADYTESEKTKILNKVSVCGTISALCFAFLTIMYAFNLYSKSAWMGDLFIDMLLVGIAFSISTVLSGLQLTDRMSKERLRKTVKILLPVCAVALVVLTVLIMVIMSA